MENVPGAEIEFILPLKHKVDYLALGHFHKQYIIDNWIFNPGSSEAACSIDFSYNRGIFIVEVLGENEYVKKIRPIRLNNRRYMWETVYIPRHFRRVKDLQYYIFQKLSKSLNSLKSDYKPSNLQVPILYLILKGKEPFKTCKIKKAEISKAICESFPVVDTRIYLKFEDPINTMDSYL